MSEINPTTDGNQPAGTGGNPPAATPPQGQPAATDDETVTLNKEDYNNLIAARDRANNGNSELTDTVLTLEQEREERIKKEMIGDFLEQNKTKFPDLTTDDLMAAGSPDELESLATKRQRRYEDVVQDKLLKVQQTSAPVLSPEEKAEKLKKLKENPTKGSFGQFLELQQNA